MAPRYLNVFASFKAREIKQLSDLLATECTKCLSYVRTKGFISPKWCTAVTRIRCVSFCLRIDLGENTDDLIS